MAERVPDGGLPIGSPWTSVRPPPSPPPAGGAAGAPGPVGAAGAADSARRLDGCGKSAALPNPGPSLTRNGCPARPNTYLISENPSGGSINPIGVTLEFDAGAKTVCVSGSYPAPGQFVPPLVVPMVSPASGPPSLLAVGGLKIGPFLNGSIALSACARRSGVKSIKSASVMAWRAYAGGLVGNGCVGEYHSPGTSPFGTGRSSIGQTGSPVTRSKT